MSTASIKCETIIDQMPSEYAGLQSVSEGIYGVVSLEALRLF